MRWIQTISWCYNTKHKWVGNYTTSGYPFLVSWVSWVWSYTGEYTGDHFPQWTTSLGHSGPAWAEYKFIEMFKWGYGPISGSVFMDLWIRCQSDGTFQGGKF